MPNKIPTCGNSAITNWNIFTQFIDYLIINPVCLLSRDIVKSMHTTVSYYIKPNNNFSDPNAKFAVRAHNSTCSRTFQNWQNKQQSFVKDKWVLVHKPSDLTLATDELSCDKNAGAWVSLVSLYLKDWMQKGFIMVKDDDVVIIRRIVSSF